MRPRNRGGNNQPGYMSWRVENAVEGEADVYIYDVIGDPWDGTVAGDFVRELNALDVARINLHISSPGGLVDDALAMHNAIKAHASEVIAYIESQASSAASWVALAADKVVIASNAKMHIHPVAGLVFGTDTDMFAAGEMLREETQNIAAMYADRAGGTAAEWEERMRANNGIGQSYRGQAAVDVGLADEVGLPKRSSNLAQQTPRSLEEQVRNALGFSADEAKRFVAGGWPALKRDVEGSTRDVEADDLDELLAVLKTAV